VAAACFLCRREPDHDERSAAAPHAQPRTLPCSPGKISRLKVVLGLLFADEYHGTSLGQPVEHTDLVIGVVVTFSWHRPIPPV
jgi:hypothetical protein